MNFYSVFPTFDCKILLKIPILRYFCKKKRIFILFCDSSFVTLATLKSLPLENEKLKTAFLFCILLAYS